MRNSLLRLKRLGVPIGAIIDVGVNHSTPQLIELYPDLKHILIEPISDYFPAIRANYAGINYDLIEAAASDSDGVVYVESRDQLGGGTITHSAIVAGPGPNTREIPSLKLDTIIPTKGLQAPYMLKVDVEGREVPAAILRGAKETMKNCSVIVMELTAERFFERGELIHAAGFRLYDIVDVAHYRGFLAQVDAIFVREDIWDANPDFRPLHQGPFKLKDWHTATRSPWVRGVGKAQPILGKLRRKLRAGR